VVSPMSLASLGFALATPGPSVKELTDDGRCSDIYAASYTDGYQCYSAASLVISPQDPWGSWLPSLGTWVPQRWTEGVDISEKAAKADKAIIPKQLWNLQIALETLQEWLHRIYFWRLFRSLCWYLRRKHGSQWPSRACCEQSRGVEGTHEGSSKLS